MPAYSNISDLERSVLIATFSLEQELACGPVLSQYSEYLTPTHPKMTRQKIGFALGALVERKLIEKKTLGGQPGEDWRFTTTKSGSDFVMAELASGRLDLDFFENTDYDFTEIQGYKESKNSMSEDAWEPLPLDRQNPALAQAIEKIDELVEAIAQDNGYAVTEPDERNYILTALRNGVQALKIQTVIYRMQFMAFIWEPVKQIAARFGPGAIGFMAVTVKDILKDILKSAAKNWLGQG